MGDKKKEKLKVWGIVLMILLFATAIVLIFVGYYVAAFIILGICVTILGIISNFLQMENELYLYERQYKNKDKY